MTALNPHPAKTALPSKTQKDRIRRIFGFKTRLYLTWVALLGACVLFFLSFDLKFSIILDKLPNLVGLKLGPNGFLQGAALTLFLCFCSIWLSLVLGFVTALARLSRSAVAFGVASFYASFFRGTPLLIQILLIYLGLPQLGVVPGAISAGVNDSARDVLSHHPAPGDAYDHPSDNQPVHLHAQRLIVDFGDGGMGSDVPGAVLRPLFLPLHRDAGHRRTHLLASVHWAGAYPTPPRALLRQRLSGSAIS